MGKTSKVKGSSYELKVAKLFSQWWGGNFSRVPASGGLQWGDDQRVAGDIVPPQKLDFPFVIECKKREGWTMDHVFLDISEPRKWWAQVVGDARRVKRVPLLIFSRNRAKDFIMVPYDKILRDEIRELAGNTGLVRTYVSIENIREETQWFDVLVTTYDSFSKLSPEFLKGYAENVSWDDYAADYE